MQISIFIRVIYKMELEYRSILFILRGKKFYILNISYISAYYVHSVRSRIRKFPISS